MCNIDHVIFNSSLSLSISPSPSPSPSPASSLSFSLPLSLSSLSLLLPPPRLSNTPYLPERVSACVTDPPLNSLSLSLSPSISLSLSQTIYSSIFSFSVLGN